jgi:peptidoglycan/xylan/chitin deacetylase (PgdA/CDA1 family)
MIRKNKLKLKIRLALAYLLYYTGILHLYQMIRLRKKAVVLMYHRVLSDSDRNKSFSHDGIIVDRDTFERHIRFLKKAFHVMALDEFNHRIQNNISFDNYSCLITFDDGWKDNYTDAYPVLRKYDLPATIFLPVDYIGTHDPFWQEKLGQRLYWMHQNRDKVSHDHLKEYHLDGISHFNDDQVRRHIKAFISQKKKDSITSIRQFIEDLSKVVGDKRPASNGKDQIDAFLGWDEVKLMATNGVAFGSHGVHHKILTKVTLDEASEEIAKSKNKIEDKLSKSVTAFSYPNGDYDDGIVNLVSKNGYQLAFTTKKGFVSSFDNPFLINRVNIHNDVTNYIPMFLTRVFGIF